MVDSLTVPELRRLARGRARTRHFEAVRMQWWAALARELLSYCGAESYRLGRATQQGSNHYERLPELKLKQWLDDVPGFDKKLAPKRKRRRRTTAAS